MRAKTVCLSICLVIHSTGPGREQDSANISSVTEQAAGCDVEMVTHPADEFMTSTWHSTEHIVGAQLISDSNRGQDELSSLGLSHISLP